MKSLLEYKNLIMSTGLIPTIVCMILCIFFSDAYVLYACSLSRSALCIIQTGQTSHLPPQLSAIACYVGACCMLSH